MAEDRTLVVLGASGFLGAHLLRAAQADRAAFARVVSASPHPDAFAPAPEHPERVERQALDAREPGAVERVLEAVRPGVVVLAAGATRLAACERDPATARVLNVGFPAAVARWCVSGGARLLHVSTDQVFGGRPPGGSRYTEDDRPSPVHEYGRTKADGEEAVLSAAPGALVVRLPLLYGDSGGRGLGASDGLLAALARGDRPGLFEDEWRTPLEVGDAARALLELSLGDARGVLHVAGPERLSRLELGLAVLRSEGRSLETARSLVRATTRAEEGMGDRPDDLSLDATRARGLLGTVLRSPGEALG